jgi:SPP1 family predicted phage head-tail adaptor
MTAGKRDQKVRFERFTSTDDGHGGTIEQWTTLLANRWCHVKPLSGTERSAAQQTESPRNYRLTLPNDSGTRGLTTADRLVWGGITMQIRFIAYPGEQELEFTIDAEAGVAV